MIQARIMRGGIIAAGEGSRLRQAGYTEPKPLVPVAGTPLIERVIGNFLAGGAPAVGCDGPGRHAVRGR